MAPLNWGIMGAASIAVETMIPAMQKSSAVRVAALASRDRAKADRLATGLGIPKAYGSYDELLADPEIEAAYIPLPNHLHVPWTLKAAAAGKHVLCEKPIALTAAEAQTLVDARNRTGVLIQEAFMVRVHPQWLRTRELIADGRIGDVRAFHAVFTETNDDPDSIVNKAAFGGGGLYDLGCYPVTTARFVFGAEPTRVVALAHVDPAFDVDRLVSAIMAFPDGGQATFVCSTEAVLHHGVQIYGTTGRIMLENPFNPAPDAPCRIFVDDGTKLANASARAEVVAPVDQYMIQVERFSEAIRGGAPQAVPLEDSVRNMAVMDALFRSIDTGQWAAV